MDPTWKTSRAGSSTVETWQKPSWRRFPFWTIISLLTAAVVVALAFVVLALADDQPVDSWVLSPTVYLSIIATLTNATMREAFRSGAITFWWSRLLSTTGMSIRDVHDVWELGYDSKALFTGARSQFRMRSAGIFALLLVVNGPLFQRAITVELATKPSQRTATLPIRVEPLWNLTVVNNNDRYGFDWSTPVYQPEFAEIVSDLNQRRPPLLASPLCRDNSTCLAQVTVAGFARECTTETTSMRGIESLGENQYISIRETYGDGPPRGYQTLQCQNTSMPRADGETGSWCDTFETYYQLVVEGPFVGTVPVPAINYTSYIRTDGHKDLLAVQRCMFTTAFVKMPIEISNNSVVTLRSPSDVAMLPQNNIVEALPNATMVGTTISGFIQVLKDLYEGYMLFDYNEASTAIRGLGPRQFVNSSTKAPREVVDAEANSYPGFTFDIIDPLDDFTHTLNELSLRYAMKRIPTDAGRIAENDVYMQNAGDFRQQRQAQIKTPLSREQTVSVSESTTLAVYRAHFLFTAIALAFTALSTVTILLLLQGWQRLGREFSMSPLDLAKAFNAPVLEGVGRHLTAAQMADALKHTRVGYGEVLDGPSAIGTWPREQVGMAPREDQMGTGPRGRMEERRPGEGESLMSMSYRQSVGAS